MDERRCEGGIAASQGTTAAPSQTTMKGEVAIATNKQFKESPTPAPLQAGQASQGRPFHHTCVRHFRLFCRKAPYDTESVPRSFNIEPNAGCSFTVHYAHH